MYLSYFFFVKYENTLDALALGPSLPLAAVICLVSSMGPSSLSISSGAEVENGSELLFTVKFLFRYARLLFKSLRVQACLSFPSHAQSLRRSTAHRNSH